MGWTKQLRRFTGFNLQTLYYNPLRKWKRKKENAHLIICFFNLKTCNNLYKVCYLHFGYKICLLSCIVWYFECIRKNFVPLDQSLAIKPVAHKLPYFWFTQNRMNSTSCLVKGIYTGHSINYKVVIFSIISENLLTYFCGLHCYVYTYRTIQRNCPLRRTPIFGLYCLFHWITNLLITEY